MVNTSQTVADTPDLFPLFHAAARSARENDMNGREIERDIAYATLEAIDEAAVIVAPTDVHNALLRLGVAKYLLDRIYSSHLRDEDICEDINNLDKLISGAARVFVREHGVDLQETALDFYLTSAAD
jgi:hypothetical protein